MHPGYLRKRPMCSQVPGELWLVHQWTGSCDSPNGIGIVCDVGYAHGADLALTHPDRTYGSPRRWLAAALHHPAAEHRQIHELASGKPMALAYSFKPVSKTVWAVTCISQVSKLRLSEVAIISKVTQGTVHKQDSGSPGSNFPPL